MDKTFGQAYTGLWDPVDIQPGACHVWQLGPFRLWVRRIGDEWLIASEALPEQDNETPVKTGEIVPEPEDVEWERWVFKDPDTVLQLLPVMPDRPVVVRPAVAIHIPRGQQVEFYASIPLWIRIAAGKDKKILCEKPGMLLSNTWFGDPVQGELCYSINTRARRKLEECADRPYRALCPVTIRNDHKDELNFERLCIRTDHLSVFETESQLVTNEVNVVFQGGEKLSRIKYGKKAPSIGKVKRKLSEPRKPEESLMKLSFSTIMSHTFYG